MNFINNTQTIIQKISEYRKWLMAIAITCVVIYHYKCWVNGFPWYIGVILKYGFIGVDIFFFLSGFGLTYSFKKNNIFKFYTNRLKKILPSYILYGFIFILHLYFTKHESYNIFQILYKLFCLEYILENKGIDWFINAILIMYLLFPVAVFITKKLNIFLITTCVPLIYLITLHTNLHWTHLALIQRVPMFLFGIYCALNSNKRNYFTHITLLYLMYFIATVIYNPAHIGFLHTTMITPLCIYFIILLSVKIRQAI